MIRLAKYRCFFFFTHLFGRLAHEHEPLSVRDNLGGIKCLFQIVDKLLLVSLEWFLLRTGDDFAGTRTLVLDGGEATSKHGLANQSD